MPAANAQNATDTYSLINATHYMEGDAKNALVDILKSSLRVLNVPNGTNAEIALIFTQWYNEGILYNRLICIKPRNVYRDEEIASIVSNIIWLESHHEEISARVLQEEVEALQDQYQWVENPVRYLIERDLI
jgi:hypothetical protein